MTATESVIRIEKFIVFLCAEISAVFGVTLDRSDFALLNSSRAAKLSYHLVIVNKIYFGCVADHKQFVIYLSNRFKNPRTEEERVEMEYLTWGKMKKDNETMEKIYIFGMVSYLRDQKMRLEFYCK
jgi:hypothetical protein